MDLINQFMTIFTIIFHDRSDRHRMAFQEKTLFIGHFCCPEQTVIQARFVNEHFMRRIQVEAGPKTGRSCSTTSV